MARKPHYRRGRRRKRGFATWSLGKKIAVILSSTLLAVLAIGTVILASKLSKIETTKLDAENLNISDEVEHETGYVNVALFGLDSRENDLGKGKAWRNSRTGTGRHSSRRISKAHITIT